MTEFNLRIPEYTDKLVIAELNYWASSVGIRTNTATWHMIVQDWIKDNPVTFQKLDVNFVISPILKSYHNWKHMAHVLSVAMQLCVFFDVRPRDKFNVFIACMFHDERHTMGKFKDDINIAIAIDRINTIFTPSVIAELGVVSYFSFRDIRELVKPTQFPFVIEPTYDLQKYIRDADLTMALSQNAEYFAEGLSNEVGVPIGTFSQKTMVDFALSQTLYFDCIRNELLTLQKSLEV